MNKTSKIAVILFVIMFLSIFSCAKVYAAEASIAFDGAREVETGTSQSVSITVSNETEIGVIQGKISGDDNIEIESIKAKDSNWIVNYNSTTKEFNAYYADGIKSGEVLIVKYKLKSGATEGTITLSNIVLTTINYETINKTSIEKTVVAKAGSSGDNGSGSGSSGSSETPSDAGSSSSSGAQTQTKKSANGIIPKLGQSGTLILAITGSIILAVVTYRKLKKD